MSKSKAFTKTGFILALFSFVCSSAFAQIDWSKSHFGFKISPSYAWLKANTSGLSGGGKAGFGYGIIADLGFTDNYAVGTGLEIVYKGGSINGTVDNNGTAIQYDATYNLQYIEIPLTLKLRTNQIGLLKYYGQFGLSAALNIDAGGEVKINGTVSNNVNPGNTINKLNAAMVIAGGVEYPINGNTALVGGVTFNNGFVNILGNNAYDSKAITNYLALNLGIMF